MKTTRELYLQAKAENPDRITFIGTHRFYKTYDDDCAPVAEATGTEPVKCNWGQTIKIPYLQLEETICRRLTKRGYSISVIDIL